MGQQHVTGERKEKAGERQDKAERKGSMKFCEEDTVQKVERGAGDSPQCNHWLREG